MSSPKCSVCSARRMKVLWEDEAGVLLAGNLLSELAVSRGVFGRTHCLGCGDVSERSRFGPLGEKANA